MKLSLLPQVSGLILPGNPAQVTMVCEPLLFLGPQPLPSLPTGRAPGRETQYLQLKTSSHSGVLNSSLELKRGLADDSERINLESWVLKKKT